MKCVSGKFHGTGAALYVCIGFVPDFVKIYVPDAADTGAHHKWSKHCVAHNDVEGWVNDHDGTSFSEDTYGEGVRGYYGGELMTSDNQTDVTYGGGVFLKWDRKDYRYGTNLGPHGGGDAVSSTIDTWTLDTAATPTGHFNEDVTGTYIGVGSRICIDGRWYTITVLDAGKGEAADEVELNYPTPSGEVQYIGGMSDFIPIPLGETSGPGFLISRTSVINIDAELHWFEAGMYDN